jgi:hypothetical protein
MRPRKPCSTFLIDALPEGISTLEAIRNYQNDLKKNGCRGGKSQKPPG